MLILIGKSGSGKDTVAKELQRRGWIRIVTDTTRHPRENEKDGVDYNFITDKEFNDRRINNYYIETQEYLMADDNCVEYGTPNCSSGRNEFVILSPRSFEELKDKVASTSVYLYANNQTIERRLTDRGDDKCELERRMKADAEDFRGVENEVDKIVYNNLGCDIKEVVDKIEGFIKEK